MLSLLRMNVSKATGLDNIPGCAPKTCTSQLVEVITDILNMSLSQERVSTCFKTASMVSGPVSLQCLV